MQAGGTDGKGEGGEQGRAIGIRTMGWMMESSAGMDGLWTERGGREMSVLVLTRGVELKMK